MKRDFSCLVCGNQFTRKPSEIRNGFAKYCSRDCFHSVKKIRPLRNSVPMKCEKCDASIMRSLFRRKHSKHHFCSAACLFAWRSKSLRGQRSCNWKGGVSTERIAAMSRSEYREWRTEVFERDQFECKRCGQVGGKLHAHHVKEWAKFPALRFDVANGETLCVSCHRNHHRAVVA